MIHPILRCGLAALSLTILAGAPLAQDAALEEQLAEQSERIDELEEMLFDLDSRTGSRPPFLSFSGLSADLGGHVSTFSSFANGDASSVQNMSALFFELYVKAQIAEDWSLFATPGIYWYTDLQFADGQNPDSPLNGQDTITMQRAYGEYHPSDGVNFKFGRWGTGHGVITREYFVPTRLVAMAPMMVRVFGVDTLYPQKLDGLKFGGSRALGDKTLEYSAYVGADTFDTKEFAVGGRAALVFDELGLSLAGNLGHGHRTGAGDLAPPPSMGGPPPGTPPVFFNFPAFWSPFPAASDATNDYTFYGVDLDYRRGDWVVKAEYYRSSEEGQPEDREGYYVQPAYFLTPEWGVIGRYDYFDFGGGRGDATELVGGVVYDPHPNVRFRVSAHQLDLPKTNTAQDVLFGTLSATFSF